MELKITNVALKWFKEEMEAVKGDSVRLFVKYGGSSPIQEGFSLGVTMGTPLVTGVETKLEGITFFVEEEDLWYFDEHDLKVAVNEKNEELEFHYSK